MAKISIEIEIPTDHALKGKEKEELVRSISNDILISGAESVKLVGITYREERAALGFQGIVLILETIASGLGIAEAIVKLKGHSAQKTHIKIGNDGVVIENAKMTSDEIRGIIKDLQNKSENSKNDKKG